MTGRPITLTTVDGGMNLLRVKGGKQNRLKNLLNGYVNQDGEAVSRPGTEGLSVGPDQCKGFIAYKEELVTFSHLAGVYPASDPQVRIETLVNKNAPDSPIKIIHFAGEYMGLLFVVAEYENGDIQKYWLQSFTAWQPDHIYAPNELISPTVPNGYTYSATRFGDPYPAWKANDLRTIGDRIEPTTFTGWYYECTDVIGATPRSGAVEPNWPKEDGAVVYEDVDLPPAGGTNPTNPPDTTLPPDLGDRYDNPAGGFGTRTDSQALK